MKWWSRWNLCHPQLGSAIDAGPNPNLIIGTMPDPGHASVGMLDRRYPGVALILAGDTLHKVCSFSPPGETRASREKQRDAIRSTVVGAAYEYKEWPQHEVLWQRLMVAHGDIDGSVHTHKAERAFVSAAEILAERMGGAIACDALYSFYEYNASYEQFKAPERRIWTDFMVDVDVQPQIFRRESDASFAARVRGWEFNRKAFELLNEHLVQIRARTARAT